MRTKAIYILVLLLATLTANAANELSGKLIDGITRMPIDFANVTVLRQDSSLLTGNTTDEDGQFLITGLPDGTYILKFSFIGYTDHMRTVRINKDVNLGTVLLSEDTQQLQEVEVVAQSSTMRFELDRKVFSVDQNIASAGGSVTDALENIPSVDVDQEGNVSLRNDENVEIWINGKPAGLTAENRAQILEQLPAESIKEIELITNPSAKFSPEGTAGIINLVMKKDRKAGYYGSVTGGITYPWGGIPGGNAGFNFNYSKGIVDTYINMGYNYRTSYGSSETNRKNIDEQTGDTLTYLQQSGSNSRQGGGLFIRAGIDLRITDRSTLGFTGFGIIGDRSRSNNNSAYLLTDYPTSDTLRHYTRDEKGLGKRPGGNAMITYQLDINKQHKLMASAAYNHFGFSQDNTYTQTEEDTLIQQQVNSNTNQRVQLKADYEWKPTEQSRLEAGWQTDFAWRQTNANAYNIFGESKEELQAYYNDFSNQEQIHALYLTYGNRFWDKLSVQVGLRGEYMYRTLNTEYYDQAGTLTITPQDTSYFQLFPSAYISYTFPHGHELQLNYTRRVDRPRGGQLNPRQDFSDSTNIQFGNPKLLPAYSSALELNYLKVWDRHTLSAGLFYRFADGVIQNVKYMDGDIMKNTYVNIAKRQSVGLEVVGKNRLFGSLLQLTTSVNFYYNTLSGEEYHDMVNGNQVDISLAKQEIFAWSARMNASFMFTKAFSGQLTARYRSPRVVAQGTTTHSYSIDLGLRHTFLDKKLALSLNVRDLLNSRNRSTTTMGPGFWQYQLRQWNSRTIGLVLTYSFGNMNPKKPRTANGNIESDFGGGEED